MQSHGSGMGNRPQRRDDVDVSEVPLTDMSVRSQPLAVCPFSTPSGSPSCGARPAAHAHRRRLRPPGRPPRRLPAATRPTR
jgi:hypothetical protein